MRAFTFTPDPTMISTLQERYAAPGEVFFGLLITQEPIKPKKPDATKDDIQCKSLFRAMSEREYTTLLRELQKKTKIGQPDQGLFFVGKKANSIARGSGRVIAQKMLPIAKGFPRFLVTNSMRPLGSPAPEVQQPKVDDSDDLFDAWNMNPDVDPYESAAAQAGLAYDHEAQGRMSPQVYAQAAAAATQENANGQPQQQDGNYDHAAALQRAQQVAFDSSNQSMIHRNPGQAHGGGGGGGDPLSARNRSQNAHKIGLQSTYASMPNGDRIANMMGHTQQPGAQGQGDRRRQLDLDDLAENAIGDLFE